MKKLVYFLASVAILGVAACDGTGKTDANKNGQDTDSLTEEDLKVVEVFSAPGLEGDSSFMGIIGDGSNQNTLVLYSTNEGGTDTTKFYLDDDADKSNYHGLIEGSLCRVEFSGDLKDKPKITYIETPATYANAIGRWTCDDPDNKGKKVGFEIKSKDKISPIGSLKINPLAWHMYNDDERTIFITVQKKEGSDDIVAQLSEDGKTIILQNGDNKVYVKEK